MRLIDADALQRRICGAKCGCEYEECGNEGDCGYDHFIFHAPTIEAEPVRHGRWIPIDESETVCSECGKHCCFDQNIDGSVDDYIFCPHCGARMDLKPHEETEDKPTNDFINNRFNTVY